MPDARFFEPLGPIALGEIARVSGASLVRGDPTASVEGVAPLASASAAQIAFLADPRYASALQTTAAGAVLLRAESVASAPAGPALLVVGAPQIAYALAAERLHRPRTLEPSAPPRHPDAELEAGVTLAPGAVIGAGARIGREPA